MIKKPSPSHIKFRFLILSGFLSFIIFCSSLAFYSVAQAESKNDSYHYPPERSLEQLQQFWKQTTNKSTKDPIVQPPVFSPSYTSTQTDLSALGSTLQILNYVRYAIGLEPVTLDSQLSQDAQLRVDNIIWNKNDSNGYKVPSMSETQNEVAMSMQQYGILEQLYGEGAYSSSYPRQATEFLLQDIKKVWKYRLLINPLVQKIGFGVGDMDGIRAIFAIKTDTKFKDANLGSYDVIGYPGKGTFPAEIFSGGWTVLLNQNTFNLASDRDIKIVLTRESDQKMWEITSDQYTWSDNHTTNYMDITENSNYYTLTFFPANIASYNDGDTYNVSITGFQNENDSETEINYDVNFKNTNSLPRKIAEIPHDDKYGGAVMISDMQTGKPIQGVVVDVFKDNLKLDHVNGSIHAYTKAGPSILVGTVTSTESGVILIPSTEPGDYSFQYLSRQYISEDSYGATVKEGLSPTTKWGMYKLNNWGKALSSDGNPITEVTINVEDEHGRWLDLANTNRMGEFGFRGLKVGKTYYLDLYSAYGTRPGPVLKKVKFTYTGNYEQMPTLIFNTIHKKWKQDTTILLDNKEILSQNKTLMTTNKDGILLIQAKTINSILDKPIDVKSQGKNSYTFNDEKGTYTLTLGSKIYTSNGKKGVLPAEPQIIKGSLYVPLFFYAEALDYHLNIDWQSGKVNFDTTKLQ